MLGRGYLLTLLSSAVLVVANTGCGGNAFPVALAKGKVLCNGQPVNSGYISFIPMGDGEENGKTAAATLASDGTFTLSTYGKFDGAIVGKHKVEFTGSGGEDAETAAEEEEAEPESVDEPEAKAQAIGKPQKGKNSCVQKKEIIVEVTAAGPNEFTIEINSTEK
jgi:hypothetical protein